MHAHWENILFLHFIFSAGFFLFRAAEEQAHRLLAAVCRHFSQGMGSHEVVLSGLHPQLAGFPAPPSPWERTPSFVVSVSRWKRRWSWRWRMALPMALL